MNYRHSYHAGNFADVIKHISLIALLNALTRKDTPFCYIDTHAGAGCYDLFSSNAQKTKEYVSGIEKIIHADNPPPLVRHFLDCVHRINNQMTHSKYSSLQYYPGSPMIAQAFTRPQDRLVMCELHPEEYQSLRNTFTGSSHAAIHHTDGFLGLKAFLPPREKRGLVLIDPPYEDTDEFTRIARSLQTAMKRFESGVYAIWYPIKQRTQVDHFHRSLKQTFDKPILVIELTIYPDTPNHLNGCGLAIINPPWQFQESIQQVLPWLWKTLSINGQGRYLATLL